MNRDTIGKIATDLQVKSLDNTHSAHEQMQESLTEYDKNLADCVAQGKLDYISDFFVVVITKKERLLQNVLRNYFFTRYSCPTPDYDQTLYRYDRASDTINFIWVIPSKDTCLMMTRDPLSVPAEEKELLKFVLDFADGSLYRLARKFNGEEIESPIIKG